MNDKSLMDIIHSCFTFYTLFMWYLSNSRSGLITYIIIVGTMISIWSINNNWCPLTEYQDDLDTCGSNHVTNVFTKYSVMILCLVLAGYRLHKYY